MNLAIPSNMRPYTTAFLYPGPRYAELSDRSVPENLALQAQHLEGVKANILAGSQLLAAPVMTPGAHTSAIAVFTPGTTPEQATALLDADPAILAGRFTFEVVTAMFPSLDAVTVTY